jgi:hypothetical protein
MLFCFKNLTYSPKLLCKACLYHKKFRAYHPTADKLYKKVVTYPGRLSSFFEYFLLMIWQIEQNPSPQNMAGLLNISVICLGAVYRQLHNTHQ